MFIFIYCALYARIRMMFVLHIASPLHITECCFQFEKCDVVFEKHSAGAGSYYEQITNSEQIEHPHRLQATWMVTKVMGRSIDYLVIVNSVQGNNDGENRVLYANFNNFVEKSGQNKNKYTKCFGA